IDRGANEGVPGMEGPSLAEVVGMADQERSTVLIPVGKARRGGDPIKNATGGFGALKIHAARPQVGTDERVEVAVELLQAGGKRFLITSEHLPDGGVEPILDQGGGPRLFGVELLPLRVHRLPESPQLLGDVADRA